MELDPLLFQKCKNNKQRKLANIRVRNFLNKEYTSQKNSGLILDYKIKVRIVNRVQSVALYVIPLSVAKEITVSLGFTKPKETI